MNLLLTLQRCTGCGSVGPEWCSKCESVRPDVQWNALETDLLLCTGFDFDGPVRRTIVEWKEHQHRRATFRVQQWFAAALVPIIERRPDLLCVPIPSSPANDRFRGGRVLLDLIAGIGVEVDSGLRSARPRKDQAGLTRAERIENLREAFTWQGDNHRPLLLIDDVVTSGATMRTAASTIRTSGGHVWAAFGLARRGRPPSVVSRSEVVRLTCPPKEVHHERNATGSRRAGSPFGSRRILGEPREREDRFA